MNIKKFKVSYAEPILKLRAKLNLSQQELANMLGTSFASVNRWENEHFEPTVIAKVKLKELFDKYGIKLDENKHIK